ncbi:MAG: DNA/RNA non-specific endonuclease [Flavobacteriaceae bacterium]|nr:DNA/RNA non-specific endonuclease [Flavobacteriaceae bacterium]
MNKIITIMMLFISVSTFSQATALKKVGKTVENTLKVAWRNSDKTKKLVKKIDIPDDLVKWGNKSNLNLKINKNSIDILDDSGKKLGKIIKKGNKKIVNSYSIIGERTVNPLLNKLPLPNTIYKINNIIFRVDDIFKTDGMGRVVYAKQSSFTKNTKKNIDRNKLKGSYKGYEIEFFGGKKGVHERSHIIALSLGGNSGNINIVPQLERINKGVYKRNEKFMKDNWKYIKNYEVKISYKGSEKVPKSFIQKFELRGRDALDKLKEHKAKNPEIKFRKYTDSNGQSYYKCITYHDNLG